jgi:GWxTD domain-containing protein
MRLRTALILGLVILGPAAVITSALPKKDVWYAQHYFLMRDYERKAYKNLSANGRLEFQKLFWEARHPASKEEFDLRMAYIMPKYKDENSAQPWNTDRARIYLLNGRPADVVWTQDGGKNAAVRFNQPSDNVGENIEGKTREVWTYPFEPQLVKYHFSSSPTNKWVQVQPSASEGRYIQALELRSRTKAWNPIDEGAYKAKLDKLKAVK